jgi:hypothetical protein
VSRVASQSEQRQAAPPSGTVDQNLTKGKLLEAHPFFTSIALSGPSVAAEARFAL